jgi:hypothetical protein
MTSSTTEEFISKKNLQPRSLKSLAQSPFQQEVKREMRFIASENKWLPSQQNLLTTVEGDEEVEEAEGEDETPPKRQKTATDM